PPVARPTHFFASSLRPSSGIRRPRASVFAVVIDTCSSHGTLTSRGVYVPKPHFSPKLLSPSLPSRPVFLYCVDTPKGPRPSYGRHGPGKRQLSHHLPDTPFSVLVFVQQTSWRVWFWQ
ncbi:hypothetical protein BDP67DRAFT_617394, partial [Colletotrichum lupini]